MTRLGLRETSKKSRVPSDFELLKHVAQNGFLEFCMAVMPKYKATKFHIYLCNELQSMYESVLAGKDVNKIIEMQPQLGKSTTASVLFLAWVLGRSAVDDGEGWPVICASYGASLAEQKSSACRNIVNSDVYQIIFPGTRVDPETAAKDYWRTTSGGSYRAAGVGGALTGMPGKILIGDDLLKDRADADSETVRESTWDWFGPVFLSRRQDVSGVCLVNTRWHIDDVAGRVEAQFKKDRESDKKSWEYDHWQRLSFPAFAEEDEYINGRLFRKKGDVLCPERFSYETMVRRRNATDTYDWNALYQQNPILKENARFHAEWFRYFEPEDVKFKDLNYYTMVDLASSKAKRADNTVILTVGKERSTGMWFVMDYIFGHLDPGQTIDAIFEHVRMFPGTRVWVESVGYQATLQYHVEEKQRKDLVFFEINPYLPKNTKSKESRIEGLVQPFKLGLIYFRKHMKELEDELLVFPQGRHDDIADSLSMAQFVLPHTNVVETPEQKKKREREERENFDPFKPFNQV